jgi:non-canonical (house-cleaning) NTP pyrophosphatase
MEVLVGSENPVKIEAAREVFSKYFGRVKATYNLT